MAKPRVAASTGRLLVLTNFQAGIIYTNEKTRTSLNCTNFIIVLHYSVLKLFSTKDSFFLLLVNQLSIQIVKE